MGLFSEVLENVGKPYKGGKGFEYGTHEVIIGEASTIQKKTKNDPDADVIEIVVFDGEDNDKTATCTLYFHTEGGAKMSVAKVLGIMVHNVGEEKKDKVRELGKKLFASVNDPSKARDIALKLINDKMISKKAYLVAEPRNGYKTTSYGDLWHYPAEPQSDAPLNAKNVGEDITNTKEAEDIPDFEDDDL